MTEIPNLLLKNVKPVGDGFDGVKEMDIRIKDGIIHEIAQNIATNNLEELYDAGSAYVSGGWMDMHVHLREPGFEHV